jgi:uncharacterized protein YacL
MKLSKNLYKPKDSFHIMIINNIIWGVIGIILGVFINNTVIFICNNFEITSLFLQNTIQILLCAFILALIQYYFNYFGWSWQNTTAGLFFVSFFFGIQIDIFTNIQNKYISKLE